MRSRRLSVRARTALATVLALTPVLVAASVAGVVLQDRQLEQEVALVAQEQARAVARSGAEAGAGGLDGAESLMQVLAPDGTVLDASPALAGRPALVGPPGPGGLSQAERADVVAGEGDTYLAVGVPAPGGGYVVAARSLEAVDAATTSTTWLLGVGVPAVVVLVAALSWYLTGRALRPVERMRARASEITAAGTGQRLPRADSADEVGRLADTLNDMLSRLDHAAQAQRQFVADASHELRSPIASIHTVMEVAGMAPSSWDDVRRDVLEETARLERLVAGLLLLARRDATGAGAIRSRVSASIAEVVGAEAGRPRRVPVHQRIVTDALVVVERSAITRAVSNLLDNAARHARTAVEVTVDREGPEVVVVVADDGAGIGPADAERVFDRFVRLDAARDRDAGGAGLGLSIARAAVEDHGGSLVVQSGPGRGGRLVLRLPVSEIGSDPDR